MLALSLITTALALPSEAGVQLALYAPGAELAGETIGSQVFDIAEPLVSGEAACYDAVGIRDLNVHIPVREAYVELLEGAISVDIFFEQIHGEDMILFGEDEDWLDVCPSFETEFHSFQLNDARVRLTLQPWVDGDSVHLDVLGTPIISGEITTDIEWVPDVLITSFVEEAIWDAVSGRVTEAIPALVGELVDTSLYAGDVGDLRVAVDLVDVEIDSDAMVIGMDLDAEWRGESCLVMNPPTEPIGRTPSVDFGKGDGSDIGLGLTERQLNGLLLGAWADGLLCFEYGPLSGVLDAVGDSLSEPLEQAELELSFGAPPAFRLDSGRIRLDLNEFHIALIGMLDGLPVELFKLDADIEAAVELSVDADISSIVLSMVYVDLKVSELQADALLSEQDGAEERLVSFIEGWVMETVGARLQEVPLYGTLLNASSIFIRLDSVQVDNGALMMTASLFDADDSAVDTEPPNTEARIVSAGSDILELQWRGSDNKHEGLSYSWRIDGAEWSSWTQEERAEIPSPDFGPHIIEVRARDGWYNVDPSPAILSFEIPGPAEDKDDGCACSTSTQSPALSCLLLPLLWVRRRRLA
jgi:hypothetical protein